MSRKIVFVVTVCALGMAGATLLAHLDDNPGTIQIRIRDRCDPPTFNAVIPGICVGNGNVTFQEFIAELTEDQKVGSWRFSPDEFEVKDGRALILQSRGGETHTFTKVAEFGGGFVADLNRLSGNLTPRPECSRVLPDGSLAPQPPSPNNIFVPAFATVPGPAVAGEAKFQCCIHPWMRTLAKERD